MRVPILCLSLFFSIGVSAQIQMLDSGSKASFRGISVVNDKVAWVSGTGGTILRTTDGGEHWVQCAVPPDGEKLDFRGVAAWGESEALVMSSGPGEASRVYRTTDGCKSWTEIARNHEKDGFWDAMVFYPDSRKTVIPKPGLLVGDPVAGRFETFGMSAVASKLSAWNACVANDGEGAFAASNTSAVTVRFGGDALIGTGGKSGARVLRLTSPGFDRSTARCSGVPVPMAGPSEAAGIFSLAKRDDQHIVAVGGDYKKPDESAGTAAFSRDGGLHWTAATKMPHGYRSAVAWDAKDKLWIAVGTNGSDISRDDGKTWESLENGNWNAVAPPFVVGPDGRIGKLALAK